MSTYLCIIAVEVLGCFVRQNKDIRGLKVLKEEVKISQYAEDTVIFLQPDESNIRRCVKVLNDFKKASGLKINFEKCNMIRLGNRQVTMPMCRDIPFI